jgi:hypothetical protein
MLSQSMAQAMLVGDKQKMHNFAKDTAALLVGHEYQRMANYVGIEPIYIALK